MQQVIAQNTEQVSTLQDQLIQKDGFLFEIENAKEKLQDQYDKELKELVVMFYINEIRFITCNQIATKISQEWGYFILKQDEYSMVMDTFDQVNLVNKELGNKPQIVDNAINFLNCKKLTYLNQFKIKDRIEFIMGTNKLITKKDPTIQDQKKAK